MHTFSSELERLILDDVAPPGCIWMRVAERRTYDNGSRLLWPGDDVLLNTNEAALMMANGSVVAPRSFASADQSDDQSLHYADNVVIFSKRGAK